MGRAPGKGGGGGGAPAGVRPRVPAVVKREVAESREEDEDAAEDTTRMQYRGFDKSKLNASRKQQRKEARMGKKQHKAAHQVSGGARAAQRARAAGRGARRLLTLRPPRVCVRGSVLQRTTS